MEKRLEREEARQLYSSGVNYDQITKLLSVSKSTVSLWCGDLAQEKRRQQARERAESREIASSLVEVRSFVHVSGAPPYEDYNLYTYEGRGDGVTRVQLVHRETRARLSMALARYRMSVSLGRVLERGEVVAHREGKDDSLSNLVLTTHSGLARIKRERSAKECVICEEVFIPARPKNVTCSRTCKYVLVSGALRGRSRKLDANSQAR